MPLSIRGLTKTYRRGARSVLALDGIDLDVAAGELVALSGPSGSGKTTLLFAAGAMLRPDAGEITVGDIRVDALGPRERARLRAERIGFVFQIFHLVPYLTVRDNVLLASPTREPRDRDRADELLDAVGLGDRSAHLPGELSAGESQRAALARALFHAPPLLLADEPTGNLDADNAARVLEVLDRHRRTGAAVLAATHGDALRGAADRIVHLEGGRRVEPAERSRPSPSGAPSDPQDLARP